LFLQVQQLETAKLSFIKTFFALMEYPSRQISSYHQYTKRTIYWNDNIQPSVYQIHGDLMACKEACTHSSLPAFLVRSRSLKLIIVMQLSLVQHLQQHDLRV